MGLLGYDSSSSSSSSAPTEIAPNTPVTVSQGAATRPVSFVISGSNFGAGSKLGSTNQNNPNTKSSASTKTTAIASVGTVGGASSSRQKAQAAQSAQSPTSSVQANNPNAGGIASPQNTFLGGSSSVEGTANTVSLIDASAHDYTYETNYNNTTNQSYGSGAASTDASPVSNAGTPAASTGFDWTTIAEIAGLILVVFFFLRKG